VIVSGNARRVTSSSSIGAMSMITTGRSGDRNAMVVGLAAVALMG
jgi:hypothetical protein